MQYTLTLTKNLRALQGLKSPIRDAKGLPPLQPQDGYELQLRVGIVFDDNQMGERGWFIDTDSIDDALDRMCEHLASKKWTELFEFRPTFEQVARWVYHELEPQIKQLAYVELDNLTLGINTRFGQEAAVTPEVAGR